MKKKVTAKRKSSGGKKKTGKDTFNGFVLVNLDMMQKLSEGLDAMQGLLNLIILGDFVTNSRSSKQKTSTGQSRTPKKKDSDGFLTVSNDDDELW